MKKLEVRSEKLERIKKLEVGSKKLEVRSMECGGTRKMYHDGVTYTVEA